MAARKQPDTDPAILANRRILADRKQRLDAVDAAKVLAVDIGLDMREPDSTSTADNAAEFLRDEWDRKAFGDSVPTYTRTIYGPDPLLLTCPAMKLSIEKIGLEAYASATAQAIIDHEERAVPDPIMRRGLRAAIQKFGTEEVARTFASRILRIPSRTVEVEADREDAMTFSRPMEEAVMRYGTPGMAPKFLSERCIGILGLRGYVIVKDENGEPVKVGTLIMGEIPLRMAETRRRHFAEESEREVRESGEAFEDVAARTIREGGKEGVSILRRGDTVTAKAAGDLEDPELTQSYLGKSRETGFRVEREQ